MRGTTPFNDFAAEVVKQYPMHWLTELTFGFKALYTCTIFTFYKCHIFYLVLRCARAIVGDNDILDRCALPIITRLMCYWDFYPASPALQAMLDAPWPWRIPFPSLFSFRPFLKYAPILARILERISSPSGSGRSQAAKCISVHFKHKFAPFWLLNDE